MTDKRIAPLNMHRAFPISQYWMTKMSVKKFKASCGDRIRIQLVADIFVTTSFQRSSHTNVLSKINTLHHQFDTSWDEDVLLLLSLLLLRRNKKINESIGSIHTVQVIFTEIYYIGTLTKKWLKIHQKLNHFIGKNL